MTRSICGLSVRTEVWSLVNDQVYIECLKKFRFIALTFSLYFSLSSPPHYFLLCYEPRVSPARLVTHGLRPFKRILKDSTLSFTPPPRHSHCCTNSLQLVFQCPPGHVTFPSSAAQLGRNTYDGTSQNSSSLEPLWRGCA
jgi:hypothetical protein